METYFFGPPALLCGVVMTHYDGQGSFSQTIAGRVQAHFGKTG